MDKKSLKGVKSVKKVGVNDKVLSSDEHMGLQEFLKLQRSYKRQFLTRLYTGAELKEIRRQLAAKPQNISMLWYGQPFNNELLSMEHALKENAYFELLTEEERMKAGLVAAGYTKKDFELLMIKNRFKRVFKKVDIPSYLG